MTVQNKPKPRYHRQQLQKGIESLPKLGMKAIRSAQLIEATMQVVDRVGLHKASVAMIGAEAKVAPSIINHYFGGKSGLLEATMKHVLQQLQAAVQLRLRKLESDDVVARIIAIIDGNFDPSQVESRVTKTWLAFWDHAMHEPTLFRLQRINEKRLVSHLRFELKKVLPPDQATDVAATIAALIDGIWLRGALNPAAIDSQRAKYLLIKYLSSQGLS